MMQINRGVKHIKDLIKKGENQTLDFKYQINDSRKIAKSLVAFANTDGGVLLIGVKDNGSIKGIRSDEEFYMIEAAATLYSKPEIKFQTNQWEVNNKITVLEIIIPPGTQKPYFALNEAGKWLAYVRVNDQNLLANRVLLNVWKYTNNRPPIKVRYSRKEDFLMSYLKENKTITLSKFSRLGHINYRTAEKILTDFILLDIIEMIITEKQIYYRLKTEDSTSSSVINSVFPRKNGHSKKA